MSLSPQVLPLVVEKFNQKAWPAQLSLGGRGKLYAHIVLDEIEYVFPSVDLQPKNNRFETSIFFMMPKTGVSQARSIYNCTHVRLRERLQSVFPELGLREVTLPHGIGIALKVPAAVLDVPRADDIAQQIVSQFRRMVAVAIPILKAAISDSEPPIDEDGGSAEIDDPGIVVEKRLFRLHRQQERNSGAARLVKQHHGFRCQACSFEFRQAYGPLGDGFIEAHHLRPLSSLKEGVSEKYDVAEDFAVLCANCHRMIHRMDDPSDLPGFRALLAK